MCIFPRFAYDIFISYARDDNVRSDIDSFSERLKREIERLDRNYDHKTPIRKAELFFDTRSMPMNGEIVDECARAIATSAFFIAFVSETYLQRPYCRQELETFLQGSDEAKRRRLFLIVLDKGAVERRRDWPDMLPPDFLYEPLFDEKGRLPIYLRNDAQAVDNPQITRVIEKLAVAIFDRARELNLVSSGQTPFQPPPGLKRPRIAVGAVTRDLEGVQRAAVELLERSGKFEVVRIDIDEFDEIDDEEEALERLRAQIGEASIFVQLASYHKVRLPFLGGHLSLQRQALPEHTRYLLRPQPLVANSEARESRPRLLDAMRQLMPIELDSGVPGENETLLCEIERMATEPLRVSDDNGVAQISILVGANDARDRPCVEKLEQLIDPMWRHVAPGNLPRPELSVYPFSMLRDIETPATEHHGFLLIMATVSENSRFYYSEQSKALVRRMRLKAAGVALFSSEGPISLPQFVIIRCEPEVDVHSLRTFLERVANSYRGPHHTRPRGCAA